MAAEGDDLEQRADGSAAPPDAPDGTVAPVPEPIPEAPPETPVVPWSPVSTLVQWYDTAEDYARDAASKGVEGWRVVSVVQSDERAGFWRGILLWWWALVWRPPGRWLVTYMREAAR